MCLLANAACAAIGGFAVIAGYLPTEQVVDGSRLIGTVIESSGRQQASYFDVLGAVGREGHLYRMLFFQDVEQVAHKRLVTQDAVLQGVQMQLDSS